jgi:hypothetical protein
MVDTERVWEILMTENELFIYKERVMMERE